MRSSLAFPWHRQCGLSPRSATPQVFPLILTLGFEFAAIISCMAADPREPVIPSFEEARHLVEEHAERLRPRSKELVDLLDSGGRILAENVAADRNFPPFRRAARDGRLATGDWP